MSAGERWFIVGGAGFLGSHFVDRLLGEENASSVTVYDNFSVGTRLASCTSQRRRPADRAPGGRC